MAIHRLPLVLTTLVVLAYGSKATIQTQPGTEAINTMCSELSTSLVLAGSSLTAPIAVSCETTGEGPDVVEIIWSHESSDAPPVNFSRSFLASNPRISQQANRLIFRDIKTSDDGLYVCYFRRYGQTSFQRVNSGCIYVLGKAEFVECETRDNNQCTGSAVSTQAGQSVTLDARLNFVHGGTSMHDQTVQLLQLTEDVCKQATLYVCSTSKLDMNYPCTNATDGSVIVQQGYSGHKFDISLVILNAKVGVSMFTITYEVVNPRTGGRVTLVKTVQVEVNATPSPEAPQICNCPTLSVPQPRDVTHPGRIDKVVAVPGAVMWHPPDATGGETLSYRVRVYHRGNTGREIVSQVETHREWLRLDDAAASSEETTYVQVQATNSAGYGHWSQEINVIQQR